MQLSTNTALAAALAPGQKRDFGVSFLVDWGRDGTYSDPNSDLSECFVSATIDRQLSGTMPAEMEITEGYVAAELQVTLEGDIPDGTPVWRAFSPYSGFYEGGIGAVNTPVKLDILVMTGTGLTSIRQFTGWISDGLPKRSTGQVLLTCYDAAAQLTNPITLMNWAVDGYTRTQLPTYPDTADSGTVVLGWYVENILRRSGFYQGPPWHPGVTVAWTLNGAGLPEVGTIGIEDPFIDGAWSSGYGQYNIPQFTPSGWPWQVYGAGQYGATCYLGATKLPTLSGRGITYVAGNAHASGQTVVTNYGSINSNLLGFAAWVQVDPTQSGTSTMTFFLEEARFAYLEATGANEKPAYAQVSVNHATGALSAQALNNGWGTTWSYAGPTLSAGWHFVVFALQFTPSAINGQWTIDGTTTAGGNGGHAAAIGTLSYGFAGTNTNLGQVIAHGPMQYAQVFFQSGTALAAMTQPASAPANPMAAVDLALTRLLWTPDVENQQAWEVLKAICAAELGALYITEQGVIKFDSRATVHARQEAVNSVLTLTLDQVYEIAPQTTFSSVVNSISYATHAKHATSYSTIYATSQSGDYQIPANTTYTPQIGVPAAQSVSLGAVRWHPQAQGYANPGAPYESGSAGPGTGFTYRDWMNIYGPAYWYDGFTAYPPGASDPSAQPVEGTGLDCFPLLGFGSGDQDARHLRLQMVNHNTAGGLLEFAVNDNTPFLHIGGTLIVDDGSTTGTVSDSVSISDFGQRSQPLPSSDWNQDPSTVQSVANSLLVDTAQPKAYFQSMDIVGDPRLQLQDVVTIADPQGMGTAMYATVYGINRKIDKSSNGVRDTLTLRTF